MAVEQICTNCGYIGSPKREIKGNSGVEILLWFFFIIPGVIYSIWRSGSRYGACPLCSSTNMIPLDSPNASMLIEKQGKTREEVNKIVSEKREYRRKSMIRLAIPLGILAFGYIVLVIVLNTVSF